MSANFSCDSCNAESPYRERYAHLTLRPSDPSELVAVMFLCSACGEAEGAWEVREVERMFDDDLKKVWEIWGSKVIFLTA
jgi:predicted RNA-binding Zn-ribbon protein involved in translation (DUF1610 family)